MKRSRVRAKRPGPPRRGRVVDLAFLEFVAGFICAVHQEWQHTGECSGPLTIHHVREFGSPKNDRRIIRLCSGHHLHGWGRYSIERLGKAAFEGRYGLNIEQLILYYNEAYEKQNEGR
jgi:hypothetical protein